MNLSNILFQSKEPSLSCSLKNKITFYFPLFQDNSTRCAADDAAALLLRPSDPLWLRYIIITSFRAFCSSTFSSQTHNKTHLHRALRLMLNSIIYLRHTHHQLLSPFLSSATTDRTIYECITFKDKRTA